MLGNVALQRGDLSQAEALHTESARRKRELGNPRLVSNLLQLGLMACERSDFDRVRQLVAEIEVFARAPNRPLLAAGALYLRGLVAAGEGAASTAVKLFEQTLELRRPAADQQGLVKTLTSLGHAQLDRRQPALAIGAFAEAVQLARASGERVRVVRALDGLARCLAVTNADVAVRLAGAAHAERQALGTQLWPTERKYLDQWLPTALRLLGERRFNAAWDDGRASTLMQAITLADALTVDASPGDESPSDTLSPREREVAVLLARGLTNKQVAAELVVSLGTVRSHVEHILMKLELRSRAQVAVWASQQGLLGDGS